MNIDSYVEKGGPSNRERKWLQVSYLVCFTVGMPITKPTSQNTP